MTAIQPNMRQFLNQTLRKKRLKKTYSSQVLEMLQQNQRVLRFRMTQASQQWTARYQHETIALAFSITEEAEEDGQYGSIASRYTKALARSMASTKEIKAANILNTATTVNGGDGAPLLSATHPTQNGNQSNILATPADLSEVSLEAILIQIADMKDDRGLRVAAQGTQLVIPTGLHICCRGACWNPSFALLQPTTTSTRFVQGGYLPQGYHIMRRLTDSDQWFVQTDIPDGLKMFQRSPMKKGMEGDFETGNVRYKVRERYSFGATELARYLRITRRSLITNFS